MWVKNLGAGSWVLRLRISHEVAAGVSTGLQSLQGLTAEDLLPSSLACGFSRGNCVREGQLPGRKVREVLKPNLGSDILSFLLYSVRKARH